VKRKLMTAVLIVLLAVVGLVGWFVVRYNLMEQRLRATEIGRVDLSLVADGTYTGTFGDFLLSVTARVRVKNHRITRVEAVDQRSAPGYQASEILDRIVAAQRPRVDAVTGATGSSLCTMAAVYRALSGAQTDTAEESE
jgi:uncharacterized protein with FMN-binding domain